MMTIDIKDPRLLDVVDENLARETLSEVFQLTEGPIWHPHEKYLTFSDIPANRMYRWSDADGLSVYREPSLGICMPGDQVGCTYTIRMTAPCSVSFRPVLSVPTSPGVVTT